MSELLIVRALRYQWKVALGVFLCGLIAAYVARSFGVGQHVGSATHGPVTAPVQAISGPATIVAPVEALPAPTSGDAVSTARQMQDWQAGIRSLDARIAKVRETLTTAEPTAKVAEPEAAVVVKEERTTPAPPSQEEVALRRSISEQKRHLEALRAVDTEAHPDVIEGLENLNHLESQLALLVRSHPIERPKGPSATVVPKSAVPGPGWATVDFDVQQAAMAHLSNLIRQRARLVAQLQSASATAGAASPAVDVPFLPLLGTPTALAEQPANAVVVTSPQQASVLFAAFAAVLSALFALLIASWVEAVQDHIAGPAKLRGSLPDGVVFLGTVPQMRQQ